MRPLALLAAAVFSTGAGFAACSGLSCAGKAGDSGAAAGATTTATATSTTTSTAIASTTATSTSTATGTGGAGSGGMGGSASSGQGGAGGCHDTLAPLDAVNPPQQLSATGLYADVANKTLAAHAQLFEPQFPLWSDGAEKHRYVYLPECEAIDTSDMDDWQLPIGTRIWKEFRLNGKLLETRLIHRYGPGATDYLFLAYVWADDGSDAMLNLNGATNVGGTDHDVPDVDSCKRCHGPSPSQGGLPSRYLGFSAIQLSHAGPGVTLASLIAAGKLSQPPAGAFTVPGNAVEQAALGYLHANCGNCHNDTQDGVPFFDGRLKVSETSVPMTGAFKTLLNVPAVVQMNCAYLIAGGSPANSCVHARMATRGMNEMPNGFQMPPLATEQVDSAGLAAVDAWINALPPPKM